MIDVIRTAIGRRWWRAVQGTVIDKRHLKDFLARFDATSKMVSVDEYMVEFVGASGRPLRRTIRAQSVHLPLTGLAVGQAVPLHVNRRESRAVFGRFEPTISRKERRASEKRRRAADERRFEEKLR